MADDAAATTAASTRPQKPDEAAFKETVAKLEKEHTQVKTQLVCLSLPSLSLPRILKEFSITATWLASVPLSNMEFLY